MTVQELIEQLQAAPPQAIVRLRVQLHAGPGPKSFTALLNSVNSGSHLVMLDSGN